MVNVRERKARMPHTCTDCKGQIAAGDSYHEGRVRQGRLWCTHRWCNCCYEVWSAWLATPPADDSVVAEGL